MKVVDVAALPRHAFGARHPLWWAMMMMIAIEGTMLVLLTVSYFYIRDRLSPFPPVPVSRTAAWVATGELGVWIASIVPAWLSSRAAIRDDLRGMRLWLIVATVMGAIAATMRWYEFHLLPFRWDDTAYGSTVWTFLGLQWTHALTGLGENLLFLVLLFKGPVGPEQRVDLHATTPLWYFVVAGTALAWLTIFLGILVS
jgi:cytochrome c oxidase subunit 3